MAQITSKISVIIPAYNIESLLEKCVASVATQDYPEGLLEVIVVDDGSTDNTFAVAKGLAVKYPNVTVLHKENGGSSSARNLGIRHSTGDYIGFVDSDDFVDPLMYRTLLEAAIKYDADMVQISRDEISEDGTKLPDVVIPPKEPTVITPAEHLRTLLMHTGDASFCTKLVKRDYFTEDMMFPEGELNEDFYLMIHMLSRINKLLILPQQYYHVFYRTGSNTRRKKEDKDYFPSVFTDIVRNSDVALNLVEKSYPELLNVARRFGYYQRLDYLLHIPVSKMTPDNSFYMEVVAYIRKNRKNIASNEYLTLKQKSYLMILSTFPRQIRSLHAKIRGL
ncbi:MAG: glycosyltransferase [Butyrivibrio sp.]|nr:glycosyltransferase [Butyrivibrio sp.]